MDTPKIDLRFPLTGREIPLDHGYLLFAALSSLLERPDDPWLHASEKLAIHNIRGRYIGQAYSP
jgi:hypothetical protein